MPTLRVWPVLVPVAALLAGTPAVVAEHMSKEPLKEPAAETAPAADARAMLDRVVTALREDRDRALLAFIRGDEGFRDRDLYPFCGGPDGNFSAHPTLTGKNLRDMMDTAGNPMGAAIYDNAVEDRVRTIVYVWPRPGSIDPVPKVTYIVRVGDQVCAVGYYD